MTDAPAHTSYSQLTTYRGCGKKWELRYLRRAPQRPAWYLVGGTVLHEVTDLVDREGWVPTDVEIGERLLAAVEAQEERSGFPRSEWMTAGKATKEWPKGEDGAWWLHQLPLMVERYFSWRLDTGWAVAEIAGEPAIELKMDIQLGRQVLTGTLDRVFVLRDGSLAVADIKSGSRPPDTAEQLGVYGVMLAEQYGVQADWGMFWTARKGQASPPTPLAHYTPQLLQAQLETMARGVAAEVFLPSPSRLCNSCQVRDACHVAGGEQAHLYDPLANAPADVS